jgi:RNA-directed DNA polymerase
VAHGHGGEGLLGIEVDIRSFFDTVKFDHLREFLKKRVRDGVLVGIIGKWLKAGVMEGKVVHFPKQGYRKG